ncbi:MAG TPA: hypothetical protein VF581_05575 [Flavobacterium sp.]|jgi:hypothetical protein
MKNFVMDESTGYTNTKTVNGVKFTLTYNPTDLMIKREIRDDSTANNIRRLREKYRRNLYFNLSISKNNQELLTDVIPRKQQYVEMVDQLLFNMKDKVHLISGEKDTIPMTDYIYPRMYGMAQSTTILIVYPRDEKLLKGNEFDFIVDDIGLETGDIKIRMNTKIIKNEPSLIY